MMELSESGWTGDRARIPAYPDHQARAWRRTGTPVDDAGSADRRSEDIVAATTGRVGFRVGNARGGRPVAGLEGHGVDGRAVVGAMAGASERDAAPAVVAAVVAFVVPGGVRGVGRGRRHVARCRG